MPVMEHTLLLLWTITISTLHPVVGIFPAEEERGYQVVRPIRLHTLNRRNSQSSRPNKVAYTMTVDGKDVEMHLERNQDLFSSHFTETHYTLGGARVTYTLQDLDHCYYQGRIMNDSESAVSISTCNGLRGYLRIESQQYLIEPLADDDTGDHALRTFKNPVSTCGVTSSSWDAPHPTGRTAGKTKTSATSFLEEKKYVELFIVVDHREYQRLRRDLNAVRGRIFQMVNFANMVYQQLNTSIVLVGMEVWSDRDRIEVVESPGQTLNHFETWRNRVLMKNKPHDNAQLITGMEFEGATVGMAFVGGVCTIQSVGVVQDHNSQVIPVAATLAHEIGHNLGMRHDSEGCSCGQGKACIMAAVLSRQVPRLFSSCSSRGYGEFLRVDTPGCLFDRPDIVLVSDSLCGNGVVDPGEECDCGAEEECPCCHAPTCTLTAGSECATGECCENCRFSSTSRECRGQREECDLAEFCTGKSSLCPQDVFSFNGRPCKDGQGYCLNGKCPLLADQCVRICGDTAKVAQHFCYEQNINGTKKGFCKRAGPEKYIPCKEKDVMCGKLFCSNGNHCEQAGLSDCRSTDNQDSGQDQNMVDTGTRCGEGMVCNDNQCVGLEMAYGPINCSGKCTGHAVCNHKSQCQCEPGWLPPTCELLDDSGRTLSTGAVIAIVIATTAALVLLLALIGMAVLLKHRQKLVHSPRLPSHTKDLAQDNPAFNTEINTVYKK